MKQLSQQRIHGYCNSRFQRVTVTVAIIAAIAATAMEVTSTVTIDAIVEANITLTVSALTR